MAQARTLGVALALLALLASTVGPALAGRGQPSRQTIARGGILCDEADQMMEKGQFREALALYERVLELLPDSTRAKKGMEEAQQRLGAKPTPAAPAPTPGGQPRPGPAAPPVEPDVPDAERKPLAVAPFQNVTGDREAAWMAVGFADALTGVLARVKALRVVERVQLAKVLDELKLQAGGLVEPGSAQELGKLLGVPKVVVGSVQHVGDRLKVGCRVVDVATGEVAAAEEVEGAVADTFRLQSELARRVVVAMGARLSAAQQQALGAPAAPSVAAYEWQAKGTEAYYRHDHDAAIDAWKRATALNPAAESLRADLATLYQARGRLDAALAEREQLRFALRTYLAAALDIAPIRARAAGMADILIDDPRCAAFRFTRTTGNYAYVFSDGGIIVASRKPLLKLADCRLLENDLNAVLDLIAAVSTRVSDEERYEARYPRARFFTQEASTYHRLLIRVVTGRVMSLHIPRCAVQEAYLRYAGGAGYPLLPTTQIDTTAVVPHNARAAEWKGANVADALSFGVHMLNPMEHWGLQLTATFVLDAITASTADGLVLTGMGAENSQCLASRAVVELFGPLPGPVPPPHRSAVGVRYPRPFPMDPVLARLLDRWRLVSRLRPGDRGAPAAAPTAQPAAASAAEMAVLSSEGTSNQWAYLTSDGRIAVASTRELDSFTNKDRLDVDLRRLVNEIQAVCGPLPDEMWQNVCYASPLYYGTVPGTYQRVAITGRERDLTLNVPECRVREGRCLRLGGGRKASIDDLKVEKDQETDTTLKFVFGQHGFQAEGLQILEAFTEAPCEKVMYLTGDGSQPQVNRLNEDIRTLFPTEG